MSNYDPLATELDNYKQRIAELERELATAKSRVVTVPEAALNNSRRHR